MVDGLIRLIASHPLVAAEHAEAYVQLIAAQCGAVAGKWRLRMTLLVVAGVFLGIAFLFAGMALLLWGALPREQMSLPWLLVAVPGVPALIGVIVLLVAPKAPVGDAVRTVREQFALDASALREMSSPGISR